MMIRWIIVVVAAVLSHEACGEAITVRAYSSIPDQAIEYIAINSSPTWAELKEQATIEGTIRATCGYWNERFADIVTEVNKTPSNIKRGKLLMPACIYAKRNTPVKTMEGDTLDILLKREANVGADFELPCGQTETSPRCHQKYRALVADLNPGVNLDLLPPNTTLIIPYQTHEQSIKLQPEIDADSAAQILNQIQYLLQSTASARLSPSVSLVKPLSADDVHDEMCKFASQRARTPWPYDIQALAAVLNRNISVLRSRSGDVKPAVVVILDTGIIGKGDFLPDKYFAVNGNEWEGGIAADHDGNGYKNDVIGINAALQGDVKAFPDDPRKEHGSQVANFVLGGRPFRSLFSKLEKLVKIKIVRMTVPYENKQFSILESAIGNGLIYANKVEASIANISAGTDRKITTILDSVKTPPGLVLVVAAGNDHDALGDIRVYPANFGGSSGAGRDNVITVVAHDASGKVAEFSNYGREYADIAAPGCDLPYRDETPRLFGTSFAAPLVTFTVALLRSFNLGNNERTPLIKQRLESAADFDGSLASDVAFSGRLNIVKTLSLYDDVLEIKDGAANSRLAFGTWNPEEDDGVNLCTGGDRINFIPGKIRKITPLDNGTKIRILYLNEADKFNYVVCKPATAGISFSERNATTKIPDPLPWSEILDFIPGPYVR